ncbi:MAG TPA: phospholipase D-like domain-containing protein [Candidatus Nanoarchaeia archaeon]|nr:phospholipase D-like domain-containing protein [Candidatus Nanoarchaeia archaeon]
MMMAKPGVGRYTIYSVVALIVLLIAISAAQQMTGRVVYMPSAQHTGGEVEMSIYFCPREGCEDELVAFMEEARESLHCAFFDLDLERVIDVLREKAAEIEVQVVIDADNSQESGSLPFVHADTRSAFMHNKFCIADRKRVWTGSMNPTFRDAYTNNNNVLRIEADALAENYEEEFQELWSGDFGKGEEVRLPLIIAGNRTIANYFCPEDHCAAQVKKEISRARQSVYFLAFSFTHSGIATELVQKMGEGIEVKGVFEKSQNSRHSRKPLLEFQGAEVQWDQNPAFLHHKVFIIDNETVITGSFNPSENADTSNDENILIIRDPLVARRFAEEFRYVWEYSLIPQPRPAEDIIIAEVLYDPVGSDAEGEHVHLLNPTGGDISLAGYQLTDGRGTLRLEGILPSGETRVLDAGSGLFSLKNSNSSLTLISRGIVLDHVAWEGKWDLDASGKVLKRVAITAANSRDQWQASDLT